MNTVVGKLLDVDRQARQILDEASAYYEKTTEEITRERERIRAQYTERAEMHIADVSLNETSATDEVISKLRDETDKKIKRMEEIYESGHRQWESAMLEACVKRVTGRV